MSRYSPSRSIRSSSMHSEAYPCIDDYDLGQMIGRGGFARVYRARCRINGTDVAIKVIEKDKMLALKMTERVQNECYIHPRLPDHTNIVRAFSTFEDDTCFYLVMELCPRGNLYRYLRHSGRLPETSAKQIMFQLLQALAHLHREGVIHRDLKLSNILIADTDIGPGIDTGKRMATRTDESQRDPEHVRGSYSSITSLSLSGESASNSCSSSQSSSSSSSSSRNNAPISIKICDFGLAVNVEHPDEEHYTLCGTPNYIAPEIASYTGHGYPVDLWSVGCLFFSMLVGRPPFDSSLSHGNGNTRESPVVACQNWTSEELKDDPSKDNDNGKGKNNIQRTFDRIKEGCYKVPDDVALSSNGRDCLKTLLSLNPSHRRTAADVLCHPYFKDLNQYVPTHAHVDHTTINNYVGTETKTRMNTSIATRAYSRSESQVVADMTAFPQKKSKDKDKEVGCDGNSATPRARHSTDAGADYVDSRYIELQSVSVTSDTDTDSDSVVQNADDEISTGDDYEVLAINHGDTVQRRGDIRRQRERNREGKNAWPVATMKSPTSMRTQVPSPSPVPAPVRSSVPEKDSERESEKPFRPPLPSDEPSLLSTGSALRKLQQHQPHSPSQTQQIRSEVSQQKTSTVQANNTGHINVNESQRVTQDWSRSPRFNTNTSSRPVPVSAQSLLPLCSTRQSVSASWLSQMQSLRTSMQLRPSAQSLALARCGIDRSNCSFDNNDENVGPVTERSDYAYGHVHTVRNDQTHRQPLSSLLQSASSSLTASSTSTLSYLEVNLSGESVGESVGIGSLTQSYSQFAPQSHSHSQYQHHSQANAPSQSKSIDRNERVPSSSSISVSNVNVPMGGFSISGMGAVFTKPLWTSEASALDPFCYVTPDKELIILTKEKDILFCIPVQSKKTGNITFARLFMSHCKPLILKVGRSTTKHDKDIRSFLSKYNAEQRSDIGVDVDTGTSAGKSSSASPSIFRAAHSAAEMMIIDSENRFDTMHLWINDHHLSNLAPAIERAYVRICQILTLVKCRVPKAVLYLKENTVANFLKENERTASTLSDRDSNNGSSSGSGKNEYDKNYDPLAYLLQCGDSDSDTEEQEACEEDENRLEVHDVTHTINLSALSTSAECENDMMSSDEKEECADNENEDSNHMEWDSFSSAGDSNETNNSKRVPLSMSLVNTSEQATDMRAALTIRAEVNDVSLFTNATNEYATSCESQSRSGSGASAASNVSLSSYPSPIRNCRLRVEATTNARFASSITNTNASVNRNKIEVKCTLMSNTPLPDFCAQWADGAYLRYSLHSGNLLIDCPAGCPKMGSLASIHGGLEDVVESILRSEREREEAGAMAACHAQLVSSGTRFEGKVHTESGDMTSLNASVRVKGYLQIAQVALMKIFAVQNEKPSPTMHLHSDRSNGHGDACRSNPVVM